MDQRQFFLRDILTTIFKHLQLIIFFPISVLVVVLVLSYIWPPTYESSAKIQLTRGREVSQADPTVTASAQSVMLMQLGVEDVNSEIELLHSDNVLRATVNDPDLMLHKDPTFPFGSGFLQRGVNTARAAVRGVLYTLRLLAPRTDEQEAMDDLNDRLITEPIRDSYVIQVSLRLGDRAKAQTILTRLIEHYKLHHIETLRGDENSVEFFQRALGEAEAALAVAQKDLEAFRNENDISLLDTQKELLLAGYTDALRVLAQLQESENLISNEDLDSSVISSLSSETDSTVVREMQLRLLELVLERNRVQKSLGENHPTLQSLRQQVAEAQADLIEAIATTKQLTVSKRDQVLAELQRLNQTKAEMDEKEKRVELLTSNFEFYWQKLEESKVATRLAEEQFSNVRIVSSPNLPTEPVFPNKLFNIVLALFGGIVGALALAFFLDYLDHGLKTPEDIDYFLKIQPLASFFNGPGEKLDKREAERLAMMLSTMAKNSSNVFEITSAVPGEGAPQVALAVAEQFSNDPEGAALLIDLTGEVGGGRAGGSGLTDVLLNQASADDVFQASKSLTVVGRGTASDSATYLYGSEQLTRLMEALRSRYKYIVINVPPVLRSHDALKLANVADGIVIVIRADGTRREVVARALDLYGDNASRVMGAVLTQRTQTIPQAVYRRI
jgi:tyrosine-protein kinase Etk/Wzc